MSESVASAQPDRPIAGVVAPSPWLNVKAAASYARCGVKVIFRACASQRLRHVRIDGRRRLIIHLDWLNEFLEREAVGGIRA